MSFWIWKHRMKPKKDFRIKIKDYYEELAQDHIPKKLLNQIILTVTEIIYDQYTDFWRQYPKSRKRYSTLKMGDLEHPFLYWKISDFLEFKKVTKKREYCKILFKMNDEEYDANLDHREWYETK